MNIIVCVKQVTRITIQNGFDPTTKSIVTDGLVYMLNPHDEAAVEEAIRIKEKAGNGEVTVISLGPSRVAAALRWCLAMGADKAIHMVREKDGNDNPWGTALMLSDLIRQQPYDILLFGKKAIDDEMGQVGTLVAECLDLPVVTSVVGMDLSDPGHARLLRSLERGDREEVVCPVPSVFTIDKSINRPRYPTFPNRKAAQTAAIQQVDGNQPADYPRMERIGLAPPKLRPKKILSPDSSLSAAARINFVMTGGMGQKKGGTVKGDPKQMATDLIHFLKEKNVIGT